MTTGHHLPDWLHSESVADGQSALSYVSLPERKETIASTVIVGDTEHVRGGIIDQIV